MKQPILLCYNLSDARAGKIRLLAMRLKIRMRTVKPAEYGLPLVQLCGVPTENADACADFSDEMLVMANFPPPMLNTFLQGFRKMGIAPVALKAVLTPTNAEWTSVKLHGEIVREREAMMQGETAAHE